MRIRTSGSHMPFDLHATIFILLPLLPQPPPLFMCFYKLSWISSKKIKLTWNIIANCFWESTMISENDRWMCFTFVYRGSVFRVCWNFSVVYRGSWLFVSGVQGVLIFFPVVYRGCCLFSVVYRGCWLIFSGFQRVMPFFQWCAEGVDLFSVFFRGCCLFFSGVQRVLTYFQWCTEGVAFFPVVSRGCADPDKLPWNITSDVQRVLTYFQCFSEGVAFFSVVYRGCADSDKLPWNITSAVNCHYQGSRKALWWFCDGNKCNTGQIGKVKSQYYMTT